MRGTVGNPVHLLLLHILFLLPWAGLDVNPLPAPPPSPSVGCFFFPVRHFLALCWIIVLLFWGVLDVGEEGDGLAEPPCVCPLSSPLSVAPPVFVMVECDVWDGSPPTLMSWPELEQSYSYQKCKLPWSQSPVVFYFSSWTPLEQPCMNIETNMFLELQKTA